MNPTQTVIAHHNAPAVASRRATRSARFARYASAGEPPVVEEISADETELVDALFVKVAAHCAVPTIAAREIIENLAHADFVGACVSVLDGGATLRVSDCGPGIHDKHRAIEPGYTTASAHMLTLVRGVGSGFPVSLAAMNAVGGALDLDDNLDGGTVVTLRAPIPDSAGADAGELSENARRLLAVLVEVGPATPDALAAELDVSLCACARELVTLEHRGLVAHEADGRRSLTAPGTALLTTLF